MKRLRTFTKQEFNSHGEIVEEVPDVFRMLETNVSIHAFNRFFRFGCVDEFASVVMRPSCFTLIDDPTTTAFHVLSSGQVFVVGVEFAQILCFETDIVIYSDSGLSVFDGSGAFDVNFLRMREYPSSIDFSQISQRSLRWELMEGGDSCYSVDQLVETYGQEILASVPATKLEAEPLVAYELSDKVIFSGVNSVSL